MSPDELKNRFLLHGIRCNTRRDEVVVEVCVFCGNTKWNLEANPVVGLYHCWACNAGGRVDSLVKEVTGVTVHIPVVQDEWKDRRDARSLEHVTEDFLGPPVADVPHLVAYLQGRRLSLVDMAIYQLRAGKGGLYENRVVAPLLEYWTREVVGYLGRTVLNERPKYYGTWLAPKCVVGFRTRSDVHVIVEGVLDGIRVHKAGYNAAVLVGTAGVRGSIEAWSARVPQLHDVVVLLDGDATIEAEKLYWTIRPIHERVSLIKLPPAFDPELLEEAARKSVV